MDQVNHSGRTAFAITVSFTTLATIATTLRLLTRNVIKTRYHADDWWILAALVVLLVLAGVQIWGIIVGGGGQNLSSPITHYHQIQQFLKANFIGAPFYITLLALVRLSLTALYRRIFIVKRLRVTSFALDGINVAWWIFGVCVNIFGCTPVAYFWNPHSKGSCITWFNKFILGYETIGILLDAAILTLPVRMIMTLQMSIRNKVLVTGIFLLGGFVIITNIVRLIYVHESSGTYVNFTQSSIWSMIHASSAVICASLPTYKPLFPKMAGVYRNLRSRCSNLLRTRSSSNTLNIMKKPEAATAKARYTEIADGGPEGRSLTKAEATMSSVDQLGEHDYPLNVIEVNRTVDVV